MTREEAVKLLQATRLMLMDGANQPISDLYYALDMAIEGLEQTEPQTETQTDCCETCKHKNDGCYSEACGPCSMVNSNYEPQTNTHDLRTDTHECVKQTDCSWR